MVEIQDWEDEDDDIIEDSPEYSPKSDLSKGRQTDVLLSKILDLRSKEMKEGFWNLEIKNGFPIKQWVPDSRKAFISGVKAMRALLSPEIIRDKKFLEKEAILKKRMKELYDLHVYEERKVIIKEVPGSLSGVPVWQTTGIKYMPRTGDKVIVSDSMNPHLAEPIIGGWDDKVNAYWDQLVEIYDEYFSELNFVIDRLNYFTQKIVYG